MDAKVAPVKVLASAVIVISADPSKATPLIFLVAANLVAVAAFPVVVVAVVAFPVMLPAIGLVTVKSVKVPTDVNEEASTLGAKVVPVKVLASAVIVISADPSKATPLISAVLANLVAVAAFPVVVVAVKEFPVMLPAIGLVTVKSVKVPTDVNEEASTLDAKVAPVKVLASAVIVISADPSKATPLIF